MKTTTRIKDRVSPEEWQARQELACAYRLFDHFGWHELIYNHITVRVPGEKGHFLINPFGLMYREVTASNLVKIDVEGNVLAGRYPVNRAGFVIHSAIHRARERCARSRAHAHDGGSSGVMSGAGAAVDELPLGHVPGRVAYHDYEGITLDLDEQERLLADLGDKDVMILRNHGLLTCGPTHRRCVPGDVSAAALVRGTDRGNGRRCSRDHPARGAGDQGDRTIRADRAQRCRESHDVRCDDALDGGQRSELLAVIR